MRSVHEKILIVDDEINELRTLQLGLRRKGYEVSTARNGKEAIEQIETKKNGFDIVVTDYAMPEMDGLQFLKLIRNKNKELIVVMMTAYGKKEVLADALRNQCNGYIEKPFSIDEFIEEIERVRQYYQKSSTCRTLSEIVPFLIHQINNPLYVIKGSVELVMAETENKNLIHYMSNVLEATEKINLINKEIMKLGRGLEDSIEFVDLSEVLMGCLKSLHDIARTKGITFENEIFTQNYQIQGNRFGLEQVFRNLLLNAIDSVENTVEKRISVSLSDNASGTAINVWVKDTGSGIDQEVLKRLFETYFTTKHKGTGLGLVVVKCIVERHRGKIEVQSKIGKGSFFKITLPITKPSSTDKLWKEKI